MIRLLISGGPGSGCTTTAQAIGVRLSLPVFDSDAYFHKPSEPPFQEQYSPEERRMRLGAALGNTSDWILSGSVATWELDALAPTHGVLLNVTRETRLERLVHRQRQQFGSRIDSGGDLQAEHQSFLEWAADYEVRSGLGRNLPTDRAFLETHCEYVLEVTEDKSLDEMVATIIGFLLETTRAEPAASTARDNIDQ